MLLNTQAWRCTPLRMPHQANVQRSPITNATSNWIKMKYLWYLLKSSSMLPSRRKRCWIKKRSCISEYSHRLGLTKRCMLPQLFEYQRVAAVGILTDLDVAYCYLMFPSQFQQYISLEHPMLINGLPDPPQLTTAFPALNTTSREAVQLAFNDCLIVEKCELNLLDKRSIGCVANLMLAASKLPFMEASERHFVVDFYSSTGDPTVAILPLRDSQALNTWILPVMLGLSSLKLNGGLRLEPNLWKVGVKMKHYSIERTLQHLESVCSFGLWVI